MTEILAEILGTPVTEILAVAGPYAAWAIAVLFGAAWLWMWRQTRRVRREQRTFREQARQGRQEVVTAKAEAAAIREIMSKRQHEVGILHADLERREKELEGLRGKINRNWVGDLTFETLRARRKGGEVRLGRETVAIEQSVTTGKFQLEHPSGDMFLIRWDLQLGVPNPAGEKVTA